MNIKSRLASVFRPRGLARLGVLRRLKPFSRTFGYDRGPQSVARYFVDEFLEKHRDNVRGCVLEIGDKTYTERLGGSRVVRSDVLHVSEGNPVATIVADLTNSESLSSDFYQCILLPQTLQFIYDCHAAVRTCSRILAPGGVLLATLSGISQISRYDMDRWGEYWRFTELSAQRLFAEAFPEGDVTVESYGNVLAATGLLYGLASRELRRNELDFRDADYPVVIGVRVVKEHRQS